MSYIGAQPTTAAFPFDQFSGDGSTPSFTLTYAPASATSIIVAISGVVQNPNLYSVIGTTLTFSPAPPAGTNNISVLYLGLPVIGVPSPGNTAYFSSTSFTATGGQTTFTPSGSYQVGFINVIRNGSQLAPADYTATNGTTVTLNNACTAGDIVVIEVYTLTSISNALPLTGGTVTGASTFNSTLTVNGAAVSGFTGFKNRIINPGMVIDQRNNGASVTPTTGQYTLDRWITYVSAASKLSIQRSSVAPTGFTNSALITSLSAYTVGASETFLFGHKIEGFNFADMGWGTASAATVTISFWVRSSLTGTFGGTLGNGADNRWYPFSYTISAANTWEQKTLTIAGDTSGTWVGATNGIGLNVYFNLGTGATLSGPSGSWSSTTYYSSTGATSVVGTNGATFYITGVQLERGSNATSFEFRDYGRELALCQRYFYKTYNTDVAVGTNTSDGTIYLETLADGSLNRFKSFNPRLPVSMRTSPAVSTYSQTGTIDRINVYNNSASTLTVSSVANIGTNSFFNYLQTTTNGVAASTYTCHATASAEL